VIVLVHAGICDASALERPDETAALVRDFLVRQAGDRP
jgi:hypothetical protein